MKMEWEDPRRVSVEQRRWDVVITVTAGDGTVETFIASADEGVTMRDGIWFGTPHEQRVELGV